MTDHVYRVVSCDDCLWQDYYQVGVRVSYPPRCPECGAGCQHEFITARYPRSDRVRLGLDHGIRYVFGDPNSEYRRYAERRFGSYFLRRQQQRLTSNFGRSQNIDLGFGR